MARKTKNHSTCNHCNGSITYNGDSYFCLMCGRESDHECENCLNLSTRRKRSRRASAAR